MNKRMFKWLPLLMLLSSIILQAQDITLDNVLPPYKFTAGLLKNGHFYITTKYIDDIDKQLIYVGQKDPILPPNYTSHVHFKIDNYVFQLPFEDDTLLGFPPPPHPLVVTDLYRDTLLKVPRINARMYAIMPVSGDTVNFVFTMLPVKRPSGGFIRLSAEVENSSKFHSVGVLILIDTKIGNNDKAPIVTSFGYYDKEKQFTKATNPPIPEFWLALEGTPKNPGLTARGNLQAKGLITPDYFMFGNWKDYTQAGNFKGLNSFLWKDRNANETLPYDDSAILLIWDQSAISPFQKRLLASTEIGIVDSLKVVDAVTTTGGGSGGGAGDGMFYAVTNGCPAYDTIPQKDCADLTYHPYTPDSLQFMVLITNTKNKVFNNVRIKLTDVPVGLNVSSFISNVIPSTLNKDDVAVGVMSIYAQPRLYDMIFVVPYLILGGNNDTLASDNFCVDVPGILASDSIPDVNFGKVCPASEDTITALVYLKGIRCRNIESIFLTGNPPDITCFNLVTPLPTQIPADGTVPVKVRFKPVGLGNYTAKITARIIDEDDFPLGLTVKPEYTATITGIGKNEEFFLANTKDTLKIPPICIGDTAVREWPIVNLGGCAALISTYSLLNNQYNQFSLENAASFPLLIPKGDNGTIGKAAIRFIPTRPGYDTTWLEIVSPAIPFRDTLMIIGKGDLPTYEPDKRVVLFDTICPGKNSVKRINLMNTSACVVDIDSVYIVSSSAGFSVNPDKFSINPNSDMFLNLDATNNLTQLHNAKLYIKSYKGIDSNYTLSLVVASRILQTDTPKNFGDLRLGKSATMPVKIKSTGTAGVEITNIFINGVNPGDYTILLPNGTIYPIWLAPNQELDFQVTFKPLDIEQRIAQINFSATPDKICDEPAPIALSGRAYRPVADIPRNKINLGRVCVGNSIDTTATFRNTGNGMMNITGITTTGSNDFQFIQTVPIQLDSNKIMKLPIKFTPTLIGDFETTIKFITDADWLLTDTTLHIYGTGIICATISVDSVDGIVGKTVDIPVRIKVDPASKIKATDIAGLMNSSKQSNIDLSIKNNRKIIRFINQVSNGMVKGYGLLSIFPDSIKVNTNQNATLVSSDILALLSADVLLGDDFQTPLELKVNGFAGKYSDIKVENGNVNVQYCALDKRFVDTKNAKSMKYYDFETYSKIEIISPQNYDSFIKIYIYDELGREVYRDSFNKTLKSGLNEIFLQSLELHTGIYFVKIIENTDIYYDKFSK